MSKRRGMSLDEKRAALLDLYREKGTVFQLKELEKLGSKEKGIVLQSIKDVNQSLVDDNLVCLDKIGISNYFWAFPSESEQVRVRVIEKNEAKRSATQAEIGQAELEIEQLKKARPSGAHREERLALLGDLRALDERQSKELVDFRELDPDTLASLRADLETSTLAVNRATDNIFATTKWIRDKFPHFTAKDINKMFEIPEELDYV
mmetsp:Transcript_15674/g.49073  ORF Transcript_15674/g.49073 Transcript_15674/m.49073 type:complete len:206 (+) Transcript_15674:1759-2376(+)